MRYLSREHNLNKLNIICLTASIWFDAHFLYMAYVLFKDGGGFGLNTLVFQQKKWH